MGRIIAPITVQNFTDPDRIIRCDALVDTGASELILPAAWKSRLGVFPSTQNIPLSLANNKGDEGEICGPVSIQIEGFRKIIGEVVFLDMGEGEGAEPLIGYTVLEHSLVGVDMVGHRLIRIGRADAK